MFNKIHRIKYLSLQIKRKKLQVIFECVSVYRTTTYHSAHLPAKCCGENRKMAEKRTHEESGSLTGYLTDVSPIKTSGTGTTRYFTAKFQSSKTEVRRLVSFSPEKHGEYMRSSQQSTPVKITNAKLKVGRNGDVEITTNRSTNLEISNTKLDFKKQILQVTREHATAKLNTLTTENMIVSKFRFEICS